MDDHVAAPHVAAFVALVAAVVAILVWRGALQYGFSQDDFLSLARVQGLARRLVGPWRILSNQLFWDAGVRFFGLAPRSFHVVVLGAHALCAAALAWLLARRFPAPAALLAGVVWAGHPAHFTSLYWLSANGDPFSSLFLLGACAAFFSRGRVRAFAPLAFVAALAWKESALGLPLALVALSAAGPPPRRAWRQLARDPVLWSLVAIALLWSAGIAAFVRGLTSVGNAYETGPRALGANLLTYAAWLPDWAVWIERDTSDAVRSVFLAFGATFSALVALALLWKAWRARGAIGTLIATFALLLPVLPLAHHTYRYYLHAPLLAVSCNLAALFAALTWRLPRTAAWALAIPLAFASAAGAGLWVARQERAPFLVEGLHADRSVDRALIAGRACADLRAAGLPPGTRLAFWSPQSQDMARRAGAPPETESYFEANVRAALLDGLGVRVLVPGVDSVRFVRSFDERDTISRWVVYRCDGHLAVLTSGQLADVLRRGPP